jgi:hypothetical protein
MQHVYIPVPPPHFQTFFLFLLLGDYSLVVACVTQDFLETLHKNHTQSACI